VEHGGGGLLMRRINGSFWHWDLHGFLGNWITTETTVLYRYQSELWRRNVGCYKSERFKLQRKILWFSL